MNVKQGQITDVGEANRCPYCGNLLDGWTAVAPADATPGPGDLTVCAHCSLLLVFTEGLGLRFPTLEELDQAESQPSVRAAVEATRLFRETR